MKTCTYEGRSVRVPITESVAHVLQLLRVTDSAVHVNGYALMVREIDPTLPLLLLSPDHDAVVEFEPALTDFELLLSNGIGLQCSLHPDSLASHLKRYIWSKTGQDSKLFLLDGTEWTGSLNEAKAWTQPSVIQVELVPLIVRVTYQNKLYCFTADPSHTIGDIIQHSFSGCTLYTGDSATPVNPRLRLGAVYPLTFVARKPPLS